MEQLTILWADDEIELLKPHVMFLEAKGYRLITVKSGDAALDVVSSKHVDLVLLDENMPGISGLETLGKIKQVNPSVPVVMITKSEEEHIMEDAIGSKISDYLIKPVNPNQILLSIKKNLDTRRLVSEKTTSQYQQEFRDIGMTLSDNLNITEWMDVYRRLIYWELELQKSRDEGMAEILAMQKKEANRLFCRYIERNYSDWLQGKQEAPVMSHTLMKRKVMPLIGNEPVFVILIDNLRYDQWRMLWPVLSEFYKMDSEELYVSILPTATQYARNSIFAGLLPSQIEKLYPQWWLNDEDEGGKNMHESDLLGEQLKRNGKTNSFSYNKILNLNAGKKLAESTGNLFNNPVNVIVYNFVDMLSHARTDMEVIRELASDEAAYRSLTLSWFEHSPLREILSNLARKKCKVVITTDHGTVHVKEPSKVVGDKNTNTNLRYKQGKSLSYEKGDVYDVRNPADVFLPKIHMSSRFIFAKEDSYFVYQNNYNQFVNFYKNTFQHGGISMEEMLIPVITLSPK